MTARRWRLNPIRADLLHSLTSAPTATSYALSAEELLLLFGEHMMTTLICPEPTGRTELLRRVTQTALEQGWQVLYLDIDLQFSTFLDLAPIPLPRGGDLRVFAPTEETVDDIMALLAAAAVEVPRLIIFDSVTMFYHLFRVEPRFGALNRKLGVYLALLRQLAQGYPYQVLVTTLVRPRPTRGSKQAPWVPGYAGGVILERQSDWLVQVDSGPGPQQLLILKSPVGGLRQRRLVLHAPSG